MAILHRLCSCQLASARRQSDAQHVLHREPAAAGPAPTAPPSSAPRANARAIARRVRQRDRLRRAVEADRVRAGNEAGARRRHVDRPRVARLLHRPLQQQRRARRRVLLRRVMRLVQPGAELGLRREQPRRLAPRSPRTASRRSRSSARPRRRCRRRATACRSAGFVRLPAGRADDDVDAAARQRRHVRRHRVRRARSRSPRRRRASARRRRRRRGAATRIDDAGDLAAVLGASDLRPAGPSGRGRPAACASTVRHRLQPARARERVAKNCSCSRVIAAGTSASRMHERDVPPRRRLRHQPQRDAARATVTARAEQRRIALQVLADRADDRHVALAARPRRNSAGRRRSSSQPARVVDGHRHADLRGRDHVHRRLVPLEDLEQPAQEAVRHQHPRRGDVDDRDVALARDRGQRPRRSAAARR